MIRIDGLDLPSVDFNHDHGFEVGPESCMCSFGVDYEACIGHSGHLTLVRRAMPDRPRAQWPLVHWDEEEQEGSTFTTSDARWLSGWLATFPTWQSDLADRRAGLIAALPEDDRLAAVIDAIVGGERRSAALHAIVDADGPLARAGARAGSAGLRLGRVPHRRGEDGATWADLIALYPDYNAPLAYAIASGGFSAAQAWAWLRCNLKYDVGGSIGVHDLTKAVCTWLAEHDAQQGSPYWPVIEQVRGEGATGGDPFVVAGQALLASGAVLEAITAFENAILFERGWSEAYHMDAFDGIRRAAARLDAGDYEDYLERIA